MSKKKLIIVGVLYAIGVLLGVIGLTLFLYAMENSYYCSDTLMVMAILIPSGLAIALKSVAITLLVGNIELHY